MKLDELIEENKELIYSIIKRFRQKDVDDLFQVGCIGLINAYRNYKNDYNTKFTTYAYPYIVGEIYKYINHNQSLKQSNDVIKIRQKLNKAMDYLTQKLYRVPTDLELCQFLEIDLIKLEEIRNISLVDSLDYQYENNSLYDIIDLDKLDKETLIDLKDAFRRLSKEEKDLIVKAYYYNMTQDNIAKELSTNQVKVSRDLKKTLVKMRNYLK